MNYSNFRKELSMMKCLCLDIDCLKGSSPLTRRVKVGAQFFLVWLKFSSHKVLAGAAGAQDGGERIEERARGFHKPQRPFAPCAFISLLSGGRRRRRLPDVANVVLDELPVVPLLRP